MIIFDLQCTNHHVFEGWFKNKDDMLQQQKTGLLTCPFCGSENVKTKLTAPKLTKKSNTQLTTDSDNKNSATESKQREVAIGSNQSPEEFAKAQKMLAQVHRYVDANFRDVGNRFTDEAIRMHRGEKDSENIKGMVSNKQYQKLVEEGVQALPLPPKPIDKKKIN